MSTILWILGVILFFILCLIGYAIIKFLFWGGKTVKKGVIKGKQSIQNSRTQKTTTTAKATPKTTKTKAK